KPAAKLSPEPKTPPASSPSTASTDPSRNPDGTYGLARSPKPRDAMRPQQREAETRLDSIVLWAQDNGPTFDPLTCTRDMFPNASTKVKGPERQMISSDFRTLLSRGVFELVSEKDFFPQWMKDE